MNPLTSEADFVELLNEIEKEATSILGAELAHV